MDKLTDLNTKINGLITRHGKYDQYTDALIDVQKIIRHLQQRTDNRPDSWHTIEFHEYTLSLIESDLKEHGSAGILLDRRRKASFHISHKHLDSVVKQYTLPNYSVEIVTRETWNRYDFPAAFKEGGQPVDHIPTDDPNLSAKPLENTSKLDMSDAVYITLRGISLGAKDSHDVWECIKNTGEAFVLLNYVNNTGQYVPYDQAKTMTPYKSDKEELRRITADRLTQI